KRGRVDASAGSFHARRRFSDAPVWAIVSFNRAAALPVGAASAKLSLSFPARAISSAQIKTIVRVLPVPGAPEITHNREVAATKAPTFCKSEGPGKISAML